MSLSMQRVSGNYRRFIVIFVLSVVGLILTGGCIKWAETAYASAYSSLEQQAELYTGSWTDSVINTTGYSNALIPNLQISVNGTTLTVQGQDQYNSALAPSSLVFSSDPFSVELTSSEGTVYDLQISLNTEQGDELNVVVNDNADGTSSSITMDKAGS